MESTLKDVDVGEPTSFLDHVFLGCTQQECEDRRYRRQLQKYVRIQDLRRSYRKILGLERLDANISTWSHDVEGHANRAERYCELANKTTPNMESVGELSKVCSHIFLKCPYMAHIGRPDILWSVNKLARSITKWTRACNKLLSRLISFILHTCEYKQYCHVGNTAKQCRLRLFQDSDFAGNLEDSKSTSGGILCIFGSQTFVPTSWMCKTQTSVSHSSTESEIVSLDAGLRMDGISALDLWDLVIEALHPSSNQAKRPKEKCGKACSVTNHRASKHINTQIKTQIQHNDLELTNVDYVSSNVKSSHCGAMLYIFEGNEAVIKMIIKGRSPTMRHVSRTHRVALDWLVDGINLDPKNSNQVR